jgi:hypothetical protein
MNEYKEITKTLSFEDFKNIIYRSKMNGATFSVETDFEDAPIEDELDLELHNEFSEVIHRNNIFEIIGFLYIEGIEIRNLSVQVKPFGTVTFFKNHIYYNTESKIETLLRICGYMPTIIKEST